MRINLAASALTLAILLSLVGDIVGAESDAPVASPAPLRKALAGILKDIKGSAGAGDTRVEGQTASDWAIPPDIQRMLASWPQPQQLQGADQVRVAFEQDQLVVSRSIRIASTDESTTLARDVATNLEKLGYRPLDKAARESFEKTLKSSRPDLFTIVSRQQGDTELLVSYYVNQVSGTTTKRSNLVSSWMARRPYRGTMNLAEVLAVLPAAAKAAHLDQKFYSLLGDQPIVALEFGQQHDLVFPAKHADRVTSALEQVGFDYRLEDEAKFDGSRNKVWHRYIDKTDALLTSWPKGESVKLRILPPQHRGPPITKKPPPLHPSLRLPQDKRPVLEFSRLAFATETLRRQAKLFHDVAEKTAEKNWIVQRYSDQRKSASPLFVAHWKSSDNKTTRIPSNNLPYHEFTSSLQGIDRGGEDRLSSFQVTGLAVPKSGVACWVQYQVFFGASGEYSQGFDAQIALTPSGDEPFASVFTPESVSLTRRSIDVSIKDPDAENVVYKFNTWMTSNKGIARSSRTLFSTPEKLRDEVLADFQAFRVYVRQRSDDGEGLTVEELVDGKAVRPRRIKPAATRPPSVDTKEKLFALVEQRLSKEESVVRENFREIHAAVQKAMPIKELVGELTVAAAREEK